MALREGSHQTASLGPGSHPERPGFLASLIREIGVGVLLGWGAILIGCVMVVVAHVRISSNPHLQQQIAIFSSGSVGGLVLVAVGTGLVLGQHYRDLLLAICELSRADQIVEVAAMTFVRSGTGRSYHVPDCVLLSTANGEIQEVTAETITDVGLEACQLCCGP